MKLKSSLLILIVSLFVVVNSPTYAQQGSKTSATRTREWLQFRGPDGTGVAEGSAPPAEFSATKNLVWKTAVPFARSSPIVTADRVFLTASEGDKLITLALDRKTGKVLGQIPSPGLHSVTVSRDGELFTGSRQYRDQIIFFKRAAK